MTEDRRDKSGPPMEWTLDEGERRALREILDEWPNLKYDIKNWSNMREEWERYKFAWGLARKIVAWSTGVTAAVMTFHDPIGKIIRALMQ